MVIVWLSGHPVIQDSLTYIWISESFRVKSGFYRSTEGLSEVFRGTSHMQNIIAILRIGTRLGLTAGTLPLMEKILCRVTVPTGLAITTHYLHAYPPQNEELLLLKSPRSGPSWPMI